MGNMQFMSFRFCHKLSTLALHFTMFLFWHVRGFSSLPFTIKKHKKENEETVRLRGRE